MKKHYKLVSLLLSAVFLLSSVGLAGCHKAAEDTTGSTLTTDVSMASDSSADEAAEAYEPVQFNNPKTTHGFPYNMRGNDARTLALRKAYKVGLTEEDLRGKYELFLEYASIVDADPAINGYEGYVYNLFPMVADNLKEENREYFMDKLSNLAAKEYLMDPAYAAYYTLRVTEVTVNDNVDLFGEAQMAMTFYHELIHFIDGAIGGEPSNVAYMNDGSIKITAELTDEEMYEVKQIVEASCFVESGAEHYVAKYMSHANSGESYDEVKAFMMALEYIIGTEKFDELFFDSNTTYAVFEYLKEDGFSNWEITGLINALNAQPTDCDFDPNTMINPCDAIKRLYEIHIGTDYLEDPEFCEILAVMEDHKFITEKDPIEKEFTDINQYWCKIISEAYDVGKDYVYIYGYPQPLIIDGEMYFSLLFTIYHYTSNELGFETDAVVFEYDFEKDEVTSYEFFDRDWVPVDNSMKFKSETSKEALDMVESLKVDNSAAHNQEVTGTNNSLKDQYERACEIGNAHGVYIWFADLVPEGLLVESDAATSSSRISKALDDIEEVLNLYPENYFDQLLFEDYKGIAICLYDGNFNMFLRESYLIDDGYYMIINLNVSNPSLETFFGADVVRSDGFTDVNVFKTQLICEIWKRTDKFFQAYNSHFESPVKGNDAWDKLNEKNFEYIQTPETDRIEDKAEYCNMDYFIVREGMSSRFMDRCQIYEYLMLCALTETEPEFTAKCEKKVKELREEIRYFFDTEGWPSETSWEN